MNDTAVVTLKAMIDGLRATVAAQNLTIASLCSIIQSKDAIIETWSSTTLQMLGMLGVVVSAGDRK